MTSEFAVQARAAAKGLRRLDKDLRRELGAEVKAQVTTPLAGKVAAATSGTWASQLAGGVKVRAGAEPTLAIGGARKVVSGGASVRQLFYGVNFGVSGRRPRTRQFLGRRAEFVFTTYRREAETVFTTWADLVIAKINSAMGGES